MRSHRFVLPAFTAVTVALSTVAVSTAPAANAADLFTCQSSVPIWDVRQNQTLHRHLQQEPETGGNSWGPAGHIGNGWPASTYAGPGGKMYFITDAGELHQHTWTTSGWANGGNSVKIDSSAALKIYNTNAAYRKRITVDSRGDFFQIDTTGNLRSRRYNETSKSWVEWVLDNGWGQYDAIFAAGKGVLYARTPAGALYRARYDAESARWITRPVLVGNGGWQQFSFMFSPGADIIYAVNASTQGLWWYRWIESENKWATGSGVNPAGSGWAADGVAAGATTDACSLLNDPVVATPTVEVNRAARPTLLKTTNDRLQYAYIDPEGRAVHAEIQDVTSPSPNGFATFPGYSGFTGAPTIAENENGTIRVYGHGTDANAHGFLRNADGTWTPHTSLLGRTLSAPQIVRTANKTMSFVAFDANGTLWFRPQRVINGSMHPWRTPTNQTPLAAGTKEFTAFASGDSVVVIALRPNGSQCRTSITADTQSAWQCSAATGFTGAAAVVPMGDNTLQLFSRRTDGIYATRTATNGTIPDTWTKMDGSLPEGVTAVGAPSAVLVNGTLQVATRGSDGYVYRSGQIASGSAAWHPWAEISNYAKETAVDPTLALAGGTWVVAFRTPAGEPQLWRFVPSAPAARTASAAGEFVAVPLGH